MTQAMLSLLEHAQNQRDAAMAELLRGEESARQLRQQAQQLDSYHADYAARAPTQNGRTAPIELLRSHLAFMQRLDQAVAQQHSLLQAAEAQLVQRRQTLVEREIRVASVRKLLQRRDEVAQRRSSRQEQNRSDEATAQRRWRDSTHSKILSH